jgi:hypothetical protein
MIAPPDFKQLFFLGKLSVQRTTHSLTLVFPGVGLTYQPSIIKEVSEGQ